MTTIRDARRVRRGQVDPNCVRPGGDPSIRNIGCRYAAPMTLRRAMSAVFATAVVSIAGCGNSAPALFALDEDATDQACLDLWSFVHFGSGYYLGEELGGDNFVPVVGLLTAYEFAEPHFWPGFDESEVNQQCDVFVGTLGWATQVTIDK